MLNKELLNEMIKNKFVSVQKHPNTDLFIYNYTQKVQYEKVWNEVTLQCRGLILDKEMNIVAKPFPKFFNLEEHKVEDLPILPLSVFDKLDGSLGILYWIEDLPYIATRGSFTSEQALHATKILHSRYSYLFSKIDKSHTYLFEIIYPQNRIVVDYRGQNDIILLTAINNITGEETLPKIGFPIVYQYDGINDINQIKFKFNENNKEGFVVRFSNNFRVKIKYEEYIRLHRIVTGISNIVIWEHLSKNQSIDLLLERVPDEFYDWVKSIETELQNNFKVIEKECYFCTKLFPTRKEAAEYFKTQKYPHILFLMLDNKHYTTAVWKQIKPKYLKPYHNEY